MAALVGIPAAVAVVAMVLTRFIDAPVALWDIAWTAGCVSAAAGCGLARRCARPAERFRWSLWTAALVSALLAQVVWDLLGVALPPSPNLSDALNWTFALLMIAGLLRTGAMSRWLRMVVVVETVPLVAAALACTLAELWPELAATRLSTAAALCALAYPVAFVSAAVVLLQALVSGWLPASRTRAPQIVLIGMLVQAVAFALWSRGLLDQTYTEGNSLLDPLWPIGMFCIAAGGVCACVAPGETVEQETPSRGGFVPAVVFAGLLAELLYVVARHRSGVPTAAVATGLLFCGFAIILRGHMLSARLRALLERERGKMAGLAERGSELERLNERLVEDSRHDPLTGLRNRRALGYDLPRLEVAHRERGDALAVAVCDVDHFKAYNDQLGHLAGDHALRAVAGVLREHLRDGDLAYRFGGEELLVVLPSTRASEAVNAAERLRAAIESTALPHPGGIDGILTVSIGVAAGRTAGVALLGQADAALYEAKASGRNRVVAATGVTTHAVERGRRSSDDEAVPRQLRSMLQVSRAAASGRGVLPVLTALAEAIRRELSFEMVCVNLFRPDQQDYEAVVVLGDEDSQAALFGMTSPAEEFWGLLTPRFEREGGYWLPEGTDLGDIYVYDPEPTAGDPEDPLRWRREDMLLLPVRSSTGEMLAIVSVDRPLTGRRPGDDDVAVLMAVADHAGLAVERAKRDTELVGELREQSRELRLAAVMLLAETLDLRDPGTGRHSRTVGSLARQTAVALGLGPDHVEKVYAAGVLHDLGKLGMADAVLYKPGPLDEAEWVEMQRHPEIGERILEHAGLSDIAGWVRSHHERIDGCGYPDRRAGDEIPLEARILAVCDSYEAMVADRPYRAGRPRDAACAELRRWAGTQFDPGVVAAFLDGMREGDPEIDEVGLLV